MGILLEMKKINKSFGSNLVLQDVSLELHEGEVLALLGENGAGKSTLIKILGGIYTKDSGEIFIQGQAAGINSVDEARKFGISIIHQELMLAKDLSIAENIFMGNELCAKGGFLSLKSQTQAAQEKLGQYNLGFDAGEILGHLTIAQQQMVEIVRAVSFGARIIVMDEPTSSLSSHEVEILFDMIRRLRSEGVGIIYISHRLDELYEITDQVAVLRDGTNVGTVVTKETERSQLVAMMVGRELSSYYIKNNKASDQVVFKALHLSDGKVVKDVSFDLCQGEILGLAGLVGAGRSETMECIFGLRKKTGGTIWMDGKQVDFNTAGKAMEAGIGFVPEDRKGAGLFLKQDVQFNTTITILDQLFHRLKYNGKKEIGSVDGMIRDIQIKVTGRNQVVGNLSGGNQQKVLIGKWLLSAKRILILDEPTRGVDVKTKAEIYSLINDLAKNGLSIIMVSSELPELINMSDRIVTLCRGYSTGVISREEFSQERIMMLATTEVGTV